MVCSVLNGKLFGICSGKVAHILCDDVNVIVAGHF